MKRSVVPVLFATMLAATSAVAGLRIPRSLTIDLTVRNAWGTFSDTRATPDSTSYFTCAAFTSVEGTPYSYMTCSGSTPTASFYCYSYTPELVAAVRAHSDYAAVMWDANGACTRVYVSRDSFSAPMQP